MLTIDRVVRH